MLKMGHAIARNDADIKTIQNLTSLFYSQMGKESWAVPNETGFMCLYSGYLGATTLFRLILFRPPYFRPII